LCSRFGVTLRTVARAVLAAQPRILFLMPRWRFRIAWISLAAARRTASNLLCRFLCSALRRTWSR
jgi:hypothetical protein